MLLSGKKILIGITGSIAAYKMPHFVRLLLKQGATVKVVMTPAAAEFVSPLVLSTLTKEQVTIALSDQNQWANHVALGRWADLFLIAPLSCNTLAKMVAGICDNVLLAVYFSATCPVWVAPAMDEDMWHHPATQRNLSQIENWHHQVLPSEHGELASGLIGMGRMQEPEKMLAGVIHFVQQQQLLAGKRILVTAGPTYEPIDPVRFIGNHSSGKMGIAIANSFQNLGAHVTLVIGPTHEPIPARLEIIKVTTAAEMFAACQNVDQADGFDVAVFAAAVADFSPANIADQKIKKGKQEVMQIDLQQTVDILAHYGKHKKEGQLIVGFALETENQLENAQQKLHRKGADLIVLNSPVKGQSGFGADTNQVTYVTHNNVYPQPLLIKEEVANHLVKFIYENWLQ